MSEQAKQKVGKISFWLVTCSLAAYIVQGALAGINPCLYAFSLAFPEQPFSSILLLSTLIAIGSVPGNLISGPMMSKLGIKVTAIIGVFIALVGGVVPYFLMDSFPLILVFRVVHAIGYGIAYPVGAALVTAYFTDTTQRGKVMGWASSFSAVAGITFSTIAGILCTLNTGAAFLVNALLLIPLVFAFIMPKPDTGSSAENETAAVVKDNAPALKGKIGRGWFYIAFYALFFLFFYAFFLNMSTIVGSEGGTTIQASWVTNSYTLGCILGGLFFGSIFPKLKGRVMGVFIIPMAICFAILGFCRSVVMYYIGAFIGGIGFIVVTIFVFMALGMLSSGDRAPFAIAVATAAGNIAGFLVTYFNNWILNMFNRAGDLHFIFIVDMAFWIIAAVYFLIKPETFEKKAS